MGDDSTDSNVDAEPRRCIDEAKVFGILANLKVVLFASVTTEPASVCGNFGDGLSGPFPKTDMKEGIDVIRD